MARSAGAARVASAQCPPARPLAAPVAAWPRDPPCSCSLSSWARWPAESRVALNARVEHDGSGILNVGVGLDDAALRQIGLDR